MLSLFFASGGGMFIGTISRFECRKICSNSSTDTGACQEIISGNIQIKSGSSVRRFVSHGLELEDGTELGCDVAIFATGYVLVFLFHFGGSMARQESLLKVQGITRFHNGHMRP